MGASRRRKERRAERWGATSTPTRAPAGGASGGRGAGEARRAAASDETRERTTRDATTTGRGSERARDVEDRRVRWRELVVEAMSRAAPTACDAQTLAGTLRAEAARWDEETKAATGTAVDFESEVLETLNDLQRRGVVETKSEERLPSSQRERLVFKRKFTLAKGVADAMREMNGTGTSASEATSEESGSDVRCDGSVSAEDNTVDESDAEDDHFDDSFDEYTDEEDDHNFSFNVEETELNDVEGDRVVGDDSLHSQVIDFVKHSEMSAHEANRRQQCFDAIQSAIARHYANHKNCSLHVFGSGATGLALAGADLDLVLLGIGPQSRKGGGGGFTRSEREEIVGHLRKMARFLRKVNAVSRAEIIASAKVPIIKMKSAVPPYIAVDLSLGTSNGLEAVYWIREQVETYTALKPLVFYLKRLLSTHHLNDAATGGCGGYLLVSLVVSHLKQTGSVAAVNKSGLLGDLLLGFLRRFGSVFDYRTHAVAAGRESGVMSAAELPGPPFGTRPYIMAEDPQERLRCFTAAAYRFKEVQNLFRLAAEHISVSGELSLLSEVAAPPPRNGFGAFPKSGQLIKVRQNTVVRRESAPSASGRNNHQYFRKANAKNSFSPNKPDWTDDPRNGNNKRPRGASAWASDGHRGFGGTPASPSAKRRRAADEQRAFRERADGVAKNGKKPARASSAKSNKRPKLASKQSRGAKKKKK